MISEAEIQNALEAVAKNELPLFKFAEWIDSKSWGMHRDSEPAAIRLASSIDRILAEYDYHHDESVLRRELSALRRSNNQFIVFSSLVSSEAVPAQSYVLGPGRFANSDWKWLSLTQPAAA